MQTKSFLFLLTIFGNIIILLLVTEYSVTFLKSMLFKRNTRQQILLEAFAVCEERKSVMFSLSEVASRVGISKAAIFRHFKNKESLVDGMEKMFWDDFAFYFNENASYFTCPESVSSSYKIFFSVMSGFISFLLDNRGYFDMFYNLIITGSLEREKILQNLEERNIFYIKDFYTYFAEQQFFKSYFCVTSIIYFVSRRRMVLESKILDLETVEKTESNHEFIERIVSLLWNGISPMKDSISEDRILELDSLCKEPEIKTDESRFFKAFAEIFAEDGIKGITVEKISERVNLAKSSLYSYFSNKTEFIEKMIVEEICSLISFLKENVQHAKNLDELIYILLYSERKYLEIRPIVLMIHVWNINNNYVAVKKSNAGFSEMTKFIEMMENKEFTISEGFDLRNCIGWICAECGFLKIFLGNSQMNEVVNKIDYAKKLFALIKNGIK